MKTKTAFEKQLLSLQDNMLNFALTLTADREEAKDLLQETTLRVLDNREKYYENVNFKGWVFTIMHNIFVNNYRKNSKKSDHYRQNRKSLSSEPPTGFGFRYPRRSLYDQGD